MVFGDHIEPQLVPKLLLQLYVIELHNILVSDPNYGGLEDARDDYKLSSLLPQQLKQMPA